MFAAQLLADEEREREEETDLRDREAHLVQRLSRATKDLRSQERRISDLRELERNSLGYKQQRLKQRCHDCDTEVESLQHLGTQAQRIAEGATGLLQRWKRPLIDHLRSVNSAVRDLRSMQGVDCGLDVPTAVTPLAVLKWCFEGPEHSNQGNDLSLLATLTAVKSACEPTEARIRELEATAARLATMRLQTGGDESPTPESFGGGEERDKESSVRRDAISLRRLTEEIARNEEQLENEEAATAAFESSFASAGASNDGDDCTADLQATLDTLSAQEAECSKQLSQRQQELASRRAAVAHDILTLRTSLDRLREETTSASLALDRAQAAASAQESHRNERQQALEMLREEQTRCVHGTC